MIYYISSTVCIISIVISIATFLHPNGNEGTCFFSGFIAFCTGVVAILTEHQPPFSGYQDGKQEGARQTLQGKAHIVPMTNQTDTVIFDK